MTDVSHTVGLILLSVAILLLIMVQWGLSYQIKTIATKVHHFETQTTSRRLEVTVTREGQHG